MPRIMTDFLDDAVKTHPNKAAFTEEARSLIKSFRKRLTGLQCRL